MEHLALGAGRKVAWPADACFRAKHQLPFRHQHPGCVRQRLSVCNARVHQSSAPPDDGGDVMMGAATPRSTDATWLQSVADELIQLGSSSSASSAPHKQPLEPLYDSHVDDEEFDHDMVESNGNKRRLPAEMRCFDTARIYVKAGDGGKGCVAFRREKYVAKGGPSGGNGGKGGSVWAVANASLNSLQVFRRKVHFRADNGTAGGGGAKHGRDGADLHVSVPAGTIIRMRDADDNAPALAELLHDGDKALLVAGGRGGRGNSAFKSNSNKAPQIAENGEAGAEAWLDIELKLVADAGIIGVPNAGKSTLLSVLSAAKPKIADYPFTTLVPNLGVCEMDYATTVFADIPGLLEGAHLGVGLGHEFLRHTQRCKVLVHVIDGTSPDPVYDFQAIQMELELFNPELADKPMVVAYNKMDVPDSSDYFDITADSLAAECGIDKDTILPISAATGQGVQELVRRVRSVLDKLPDEPLRMETNAINAQTLPAKRSTARLDEFEIEADLAGPRVWIVHGEAVERFAQMTNWDYYEAVRRFQRVLEASGINKSLRSKGVKEGDTVAIGDAEFLWSDDQSEGALYEAWLQTQAESGRPGKGMARWPHMSA